MAFSGAGDGVRGGCDGDSGPSAVGAVTTSVSMATSSLAAVLWDSLVADVSSSEEAGCRYSNGLQKNLYEDALSGQTGLKDRRTKSHTDYTIDMVS